MPFCLENYIPLFKGLVDYFGFIKRRLERTKAYISQNKNKPVLPYMIEETCAPKIIFTPNKKNSQMQAPKIEEISIPKKKYRTSRYSSRNSLSSAFGDNLRSNRNHLLLKHERYQDQFHKNDIIIVKKLTKEQNELLKKHEDFVRLMEEKDLKLVNGSVIEQCKMIMTITRNLIGSSFNEKIVFNEKKLLNILYEILLYNNDSEIDKLALENFAVISR